ncbi:MAG: peptidoglycan DD-metalloendopeptidase family protein [Pseudomonadota bacterium]
MAAAAALGQSEQDAEQTRQRLQALQTDIAAISRTLQEKEQERGGLQNELRASELNLSELRQAEKKTQREISTTRVEMNELVDEQAELQRAAEEQQQAVVKELRSLWHNGNADQLRILLSEENPQDLARQLTYHRYFFKARSELLDQYEATLARLARSETALEQREQSLSAALIKLNQQREAVVAANEKRRQLIASIERELADDAQVLAERQRDQAQLAELLQKLETAVAQLITEVDVEAFSEAKGSMPLPVKGKLNQRFGRPRNQGKMRWQGISLLAETGAAVSAVHHGRVVFADWLRGSGLLMVIDHGEGYMSLYAHNDSLLREVGDWVSTGTAIATVGNSGGQDQAGLYFEIRKDGKPMDPLRWVRG